ncbi:MAG TPA: exonuclease domain-containing protein, partial [Candidatus Paceibacterota bacterium]|nr:exonuclease domain-containing protein [Candidatus Paceibacterota bacterium]
KGTYAIVDTETTGMSASLGQIIEIGILRVENGEVVRTFHSLVNPGRLLSHTIQGITGITDEELMHAPVFEDIASDVLELLEGAVLVANNARFDYSFIKSEFERLERPYRAKTLCTVKLSRSMFPEQQYHNLDAVMEAHGLSCGARHRAFEDAEVLWQFFNAVEKKHGEEFLTSAINRALKRHTLPAAISPELIKSIPNTPGVYIFYNAEGDVLYVGKSVKMRSRVLSHFANDISAGKELRMCQETADIEYRETSGELSALFLESQLVKELSPVYNRMLREVKELAVIMKKIDERGYATLSIEYTGEIDQEELKSVLAVCRSKVQAKAFLRKLAKDHELCSKLMGLEKAAHACFARQLGNCNGACIGEEDAKAYNKRFDKAFARYRIKSWPFGGPVAVKDEAEEGEGTAYVIDNWCLTEVISYSGEHKSSQKVSAMFDLDSYKILSRFLLNPKNSRSLVQLQRS